MPRGLGAREGPSVTESITPVCPNAINHAEPSSFFRFGPDPRGFDILPDLPGVDFDAAWERRVKGVIDAKRVSTHSISRDDLIAASLLPAGRKTLTPPQIAKGSKLIKADDTR